MQYGHLKLRVVYEQWYVHQVLLLHLPDNQWNL